MQRIKHPLRSCFAVYRCVTVCVCVCSHGQSCTHAAYADLRDPYQHLCSSVLYLSMPSRSCISGRAIAMELLLSIRVMVQAWLTQRSALSELYWQRATLAVRPLAHFGTNFRRCMGRRQQHGDKHFTSNPTSTTHPTTTAAHTSAILYNGTITIVTWIVHSCDWDVLRRQTMPTSLPDYSCHHFRPHSVSTAFKIKGEHAYANCNFACFGFLYWFGIKGWERKR